MALFRCSGGGHSTTDVKSLISTSAGEITDAVQWTDGDYTFVDITLSISGGAYPSISFAKIVDGATFVAVGVGTVSGKTESYLRYSGKIPTSVIYDMAYGSSSKDGTYKVFIIMQKE